MSTEVKKEIELEIAHVLFIDIVGYSKLSIDQQRRLLEHSTRSCARPSNFTNAEAKVG